MGGEDAIPFNPTTIAVKQIGQRWKIADSNNWLLDFWSSPRQRKSSIPFHQKIRVHIHLLCRSP
jgi:hypothetical protein